jgi:hypothetical protein
LLSSRVIDDRYPVSPTESTILICQSSEKEIPGNRKIQMVKANTTLKFLISFSFFTSPLLLTIHFIFFPPVDRGIIHLIATAILPPKH